MRLRYFQLGGVLVAAALTAVPAHAWQVSPDEHAKHHPGAQATPAPAPQAKGMAGMKEAGARLEELVAKMNAAQGQAKVDAIAGVNAVLFHTFTQKRVAGWDTWSHPPAAARAAGAISIASWIVVVLAGRMMSYTMF